MAQSTQTHAFVTGGGTGIGLAIARKLAGAGYAVTIAGRREPQLKDACAQIPGSHYLCLDVADETQVLAVFAELGRLGRLPSILVNNAGAAETAAFDRTSMNLWHRMLNVNLTGAFLCARAALPAMKQAGFGRIITIASTAGLKGYAYTAAYSAAKHGVIGMTRALALEIARTGITANAVCPGFTETDISQQAVANIRAKTGRTADDALGELTKFNPQGRLITPDEVAETVLWLASARAGAITGQAIAVAGGEVM